MLIRLLCILLLAGSVWAGETLVDADIEKPNGGFQPEMGVLIAITNDSGFSVVTLEDVGNGPSLHFMNGVNNSFASTSNFDNYSEMSKVHIWSIGDTAYVGTWRSSTVPRVVYKFFNGTEICNDTVGDGNAGFPWVGAWGDGDSWVSFGKLATTQMTSNFMNAAALCGGTAFAATDTTAAGATDQEDFKFGPSSSGMLIFNVEQEEMHFLEPDGTLNDNAIDPVFANVRNAVGADTYGDIGTCPGSADGSNDTTYWAVVDETTLHVQVYSIVTDAVGGTAALSDSSGTITTGPRPTNHLADWQSAVNPHLTLAGDGLIYSGKDWNDTAAGGAGPGSWDTAGMAIYVLQDRSDITGTWVKTVISTTAGEVGNLSAPWLLADYPDADSSTHVIAWTAGPVYTACYMTDITIATPAAGPPPVAEGNRRRRLLREN